MSWFCIQDIKCQQLVTFFHQSKKKWQVVFQRLQEINSARSCTEHQKRKSNPDSVQMSTSAMQKQTTIPTKPFLGSTTSLLRSCPRARRAPRRNPCPSTSGALEGARRCVNDPCVGGLWQTPRGQRIRTWCRAREAIEQGFQYLQKKFCTWVYLNLCNMKLRKR